MSTILLRSPEEREEMSREKVAERKLTPDEELQTRGGEQGEGGSKSSSTIFLRSAEERADTSMEEGADTRRGTTDMRRRRTG